MFEFMQLGLTYTVGSQLALSWLSVGSTVGSQLALQFSRVFVNFTENEEIYFIIKGSAFATNSMILCKKSRAN